MSDIAPSQVKIQAESVESTSAVSESSMFAIGGAINYLLGNKATVGDIVESLLDETTFQAQRDTTWVLMDGRSIVGTELQTLTGLSVLPDARGRYLRMKSYSSGVDPHGNLPVGTVYADQFASHIHGITATAGDPASYSPGIRGAGNNGDTHSTSPDVLSINPTGGSETNPKTVIVNIFIKINP